MTPCFSTLAIHAPYRERARLLIAQAPNVPWVVVTDEPADFVDLPVRAIRHAPTGPMAIDYLERLAPTGQNRGAAAYHDKRFAIRAALEEAETAIYLDADSKLGPLPAFGRFPSGLAVYPLVERSIAEHLETCGSWRLIHFEALARHLTGGTEVLSVARWCHETPLAVTRDGRESLFFEAWAKAAEFLQGREVFSGEGGVIGLAAEYAGWRVDFTAILDLAAAIEHEGGGPKA